MSETVGLQPGEGEEFHAEQLAEVVDHSQEGEEEKELSPKEAADRKLAILLDENFKDYAVRFANIGEYRAIMETGNFSRDEVYLPNFTGHGPNFLKYLKESKGHWPSVAADQTDWNFSTINMLTYQRLINLLCESHQSVLEESSDKSNLREKTLKRFRESIMEKIGYGDFDKMDDFYLQRLSHILEGGHSQTLDEEPWLKKYINNEQFSVIRKFINDEKEWIEDYTNLRKLINALSYIKHKSGEEIEGSNQESQYHLALIFTLEALSDEKWFRADWKWLNPKETKGYQPQDHLLGAISTMGNKELLEEMIKLSSNSGRLAHPVFRSNGSIAWPKAKNQDE